VRAKYRYPESSHGSDTEQSGDDDVGGSDDHGDNGGGHVIKEEPNSQVPMDTTTSGSNREERMQEALQDNPHSDWVKVEPQDTFNLSPPAPESSDEETDHEEPGDDGTSTEDWTDIFMRSDERAESKLETGGSTLKESAMGESDNAMEYDQEHFFKHLVFYLDSPSCARQNGLSVSTSHESVIEARFATVSKEILAYGGKITTDIHEPKLTHVVMDNADLSRRITVMRLTEKPKRRRFVLTDFIDYCVEEKTLGDEDQFMP